MKRAALAAACAWTRIVPIALDQPDHEINELRLLGSGERLENALAGRAYLGPDAVENFTNRSPYPTLHLLRESSIERAVQAFPQAEAIYGANVETLKRLGPDGWAALGVGRSQ